MKTEFSKASRQNIQHKMLPFSRATILSAITAQIIASTIALSLPQHAYATSLSGSIEHSEKLAPVSEKFNKQEPFNEKLIEPSNFEDWYEIPSWLAGTWRTLQTTRTYKLDEQSGESESNATPVFDKERETFGYQQDRQNRFWALAAAPVEICRQPKAKINTDNNSNQDQQSALNIYLQRKNTLLMGSNEQAILRTRDLLIYTNSTSQKIETIQQRESIRKFKPLESNVVAISTDSQIYDSKGFPIGREKQIEIKIREKPFRRTDSLNGISLFASISKFFQHRGQINAIPEKEQ